MSLNDKCRILMIANEDIYHPNGGLGVHVGFIARELAKDPRFAITVLHRPWNQIGGVSFRDNLWLIGVENWNTYNTKHGFINKMQTDFNFTQSALEFLGSEPFDLIHCHDGNLWQVVRHLKALWKVPTVLTIHLSFLLAHPPFASNPYYIYDVQLETAAIHEADHLITVSQSYGKTLKQHYFIDKPLHIIHNAVDSSFLASVPYDHALRKKYGDKPLIVYVGRLVPTKGVGFIIEAVKALPEHQFIMIAQTSPSVENTEPLAKAVRRLHDQYPNFEWINYCEQDLKWRLMKCADLGLMPSLHEPFGIVALEWMGLGTPFIVANVGGLQDFCTSQNSVLIEPSRDNLITAIQTFTRSESRIEEGIQTAQTYSWERVVHRLKQIYLGEIKNEHVDIRQPNRTGHAYSTKTLSI